MTHYCRTRSMLAASLFSVIAIAGTVTLGGCHHNSNTDSATTVAANTASLNAAKAAFFEGWVRKNGTTFTTEKLSRVVDTSEDLLSFDGMSKDKTVISGWKAYSAIWGPGMNNFTNATLSELTALRTWVDGDLAITASIARIYGELPNNQKLDVQGHLTLGWKKDAGQWRIVHEHMSLGVKQ